MRVSKITLSCGTSIPFSFAMLTRADESADTIAELLSDGKGTLSPDRYRLMVEFESIDFSESYLEEQSMVLI